MNRKIGLISVILSAVLFVVSACGCSRGFIAEKEVNRKASTGESWTVMIYMCASAMEDEYGRGSELLNNLSCDLPANINITVETGGCKEWKTDEIKNDKIQDYIVQKNGLRLIEETEEKNMGTAETYGDFLRRSMARYPADHYISVIWGDGGGPLAGAAYDSSYEFDPLSINEIGRALSGIGTKLDIIGFDSSLMSSIETVSAVSVYADYMVASEGIMPYGGWNYRQLFEYLAENPSASAQDVSVVICDGVMGNASGEEKEETVMTAIKLEGAANLVQTFDGLSRQMAYDAQNADSLRNMTKYICEGEYMGANSLWEGYSNLIDLSSLSDAVFNATKSDLARIDNTLSKIIAYRVSGKAKESACGISVYYPVNRLSSEIEEYKNICPSAGYIDYIEQISPMLEIEGRATDYTQTDAYQYYAGESELNNISASADLNGRYILSVSVPGIISRTGVNVYRYDEEEGRYFYLTTDYNTAFDSSTNTYEYEFTNKQLVLNGVAVSAYLVSSGDKYDIYSIPVIYKDELSSLRVRKTKDTEKDEYKVLGIWSGIGKVTGLADRKLKMPAVGESITPIYSVYGDDKENYIEGKSMTIVFGGLSVKEKTLGNGDYIVSYTTVDMYAVERESNITNVTAVKGKFKISG